MSVTIVTFAFLSCHKILSYKNSVVPHGLFRTGHLKEICYKFFYCKDYSLNKVSGIAKKVILRVSRIMSGI